MCVFVCLNAGYTVIRIMFRVKSDIKFTIFLFFLKEPLR